MQDSILMVLMIGLIILFLIVLTFQHFRMKSILNAGNQESLSTINSMNQQLAELRFNVMRDVKGDLNTFNHMHTQQLQSANQEVLSHLMSDTKRQMEAFNEVSKQVVALTVTQKSLDTISHQIVDLQKILTNKSLRGQYGEVELYSLLENAFGLNKQLYQQQYQLSNNTRADAVIFGPKAMGMIVIDAKFPLENYLRMYDDQLAKSDQMQAQSQFKRDVKNHLNAISDKYIIKNETAEIAFLFVPSEAIFAEIYGKHDDLVQYAYSKHVYVVSPSTMMAYITTLKAVLLNIQQSETLHIMQDEFSKLALEFERFSIRSEALSKSYQTVYEDMNKLTITTQKIRRRFEDIMAVDLEDKVEGNEQ